MDMKEADGELGMLDGEASAPQVSMANGPLVEDGDNPSPLCRAVCCQKSENGKAINSPCSLDVGVRRVCPVDRLGESAGVVTTFRAVFLRDSLCGTTFDRTPPCSTGNSRCTDWLDWCVTRDEGTIAAPSGKQAGIDTGFITSTIAIRAASLVVGSIGGRQLGGRLVHGCRDR